MCGQARGVIGFLDLSEKQASRCSVHRCPSLPAVFLKPHAGKYCVLACTNPGDWGDGGLGGFAGGAVEWTGKYSEYWGFGLVGYVE
jgi:hypothetical protein